MVSHKIECGASFVVVPVGHTAEHSLVHQAVELSHNMAMSLLHAYLVIT